MSFLQLLEERLRLKKRAIEDWRTGRLGSAPPPVYSSVDIRNAGFKISVVDTNLFPSGFNNLCETFSERAAVAFRSFFDRHLPGIRRILILPEDHTRNDFYQRNLLSLKQILSSVGFEVEIGTTLLGEFRPDLILINNDLTSGTPESLKGLRQIVLPSPLLGWHSRRKSDHFRIYSQLIREASSILEIDPWRLYPLTTLETGIDLEDEACLTRLRSAADRLLKAIRQKYLEVGITREPYLFLKNNSGTYGMGILHIHSGEEILALGRRRKNKLLSAKGGRVVTELLLQEGIPTIDRHEGKPLEPVVYLVGGEAVGAFFRLHEEKNELENLNAPGMSFSCLCLHKFEKPGRTEALFEVGAFLGRIASLAAALELTELEQTLAA